MRFWLTLFLFSCCGAVQAQSAIEITAEPHHHLILQNNYVRAFRVEIPSGDTTLLHNHAHDYLFVSLGPAQISNQIVGKPVIYASVQEGQTVAADGRMTHAIHNTGATPFRNVTVELLQDEKARQTPPAKWDEERGLDVLQGGTKEILFVKDGVRVSETELQPGGMIPRHHHDGPHLIIAITDLDLRSDVVGKGATMIQLHGGEVSWVEGNLTHTVMNMGKAKAKFVALEFR
jgi:quercetin dioxygenase-like cupin family protein